MRAAHCRTARISHSFAWEKKLAALGDGFIDHRDRLQADIALHTNITVQSVSAKLDMLALMKDLLDPRERKARDFIETHGGLQAVSTDEDLRTELQRILGTKELTAADLRKEMNVGVEEIIKANEEIFSRKFSMQLSIIVKEVEATAQREGDRIIKAIRGRPAYERLLDWVSLRTRQGDAIHLIWPCRTYMNFGRTWYDFFQHHLGSPSLDTITNDQIGMEGER